MKKPFPKFDSLREKINRLLIGRLIESIIYIAYQRVFEDIFISMIERILLREGLQQSIEFVSHNMRLKDFVNVSWQIIMKI